MNNLNFIAQDNRVCQVTFESNVNKAIQAVAELSREVLPETISPFKYPIKNFEFPIGYSIKRMIFKDAFSKWTVE